MFASLEPTKGIYLDVYAESVQRMMDEMEVATECYLGVNCFGATLHRGADGSFWQTTPPVGDKPSGYRDVCRLTEDQTRVIVYTTPNGYRLHGDNPVHTLDVAAAARYPPTNFLWQWSTNTSLKYTTENEWWAYCPDQSETIENAFLQHSSQRVQQSEGLGGRYQTAAKHALEVTLTRHDHL